MVGSSQSILAWWIGYGDGNQYTAHLGGDDERYVAKGSCGIFKGRFVILYFLHTALKRVWISWIFEANRRPEGAIDFARASCKRVDTERYNHGRARLGTAKRLFSNIRA